MLRVGIEIHARILSSSKLFSRASAVSVANGQPNSTVDLLDYGVPGSMPVLNAYCVEQAIRAGLALNGDVQLHSSFDRKHYSYCDQPLGYQITQNSHPIVIGGYLVLASSGKNIRLSHMQLEQDTAKSFHLPGQSLVDFNRAGVGLLEIVSHPDMETAQQASEYVKTMQGLLRHIQVCDGRMEDGSLRADINVTVGKSRRVEVKNLNSLRSIERAISCEETRLALEPEGLNETRGFDAISGKTHALREKDTNLDYRFMPEPDLLPLTLTKESVAKVLSSLSELPDQTRFRLIDMGLQAYSEQLLNRPILLGLLENCLNAKPELDPKDVANWICNLLGSMAQDKLRTINANDLATVAWQVQQKQISTSAAKDLITLFVGAGLPLPAATSSTTNANALELEHIALQVLKNHPNEVDRFKKGKIQLLNFLVGKVMQQAKGADAAKVKELVVQIMKTF